MHIVTIYILIAVTIGAAGGHPIPLLLGFIVVLALLYSETRKQKQIANMNKIKINKRPK